MTTLDLSGRINEAGELEVNLPTGLPTGNVRVRIYVPDKDISEVPWEQRLLTEEELREALTFGRAQTGAEVVAQLEQNSDRWKTQNITAPVEWLEALLLYSAQI